MRRLFRLPLEFQLRASNNGFKKRPFIIPTGFGLLFGALAFVQLVMAISSQNNLIYFFVFAEISIALTSMFFTNYNIYRTYLKKISSQELYAQENNTVFIELASSDKKTPFHVFVRWNFEKNSTYASDSAIYELFWKPKRRGYQKFPKVHFESQFPFGLLKSWKVCQTTDSILVFPQRKGSLDIFKSSSSDQESSSQGLFQELKEYQRGDSPRRIDWRASQRTQKLLVKKFEDQKSSKMNLDWEYTRHLGSIEDRISQMALWVDVAQTKNFDFQVILPGWTSGVGSGKEHARSCLTKLATWTPPQLVSS